MLTRLHNWTAGRAFGSPVMQPVGQLHFLQLIMQLAKFHTCSEQTHQASLECALGTEMPNPEHGYLHMYNNNALYCIKQ